jgi:Family of unknown function (DUF6526)
MAEQSFAHHGRYRGEFHFFALPVLAINLINSLVMLFRAGISWYSVLQVFVAAALAIGFLSVRLQILTVQDRLIRLEERLRLERLLPPDLKGRIREFTRDQLVALRFASDAELPALARKVLEEKMQARKPIKQLVKTWRADFLRA